MSTNIIEQIAAKAAQLPPEQQREALEFVEKLADDDRAARLRARFPVSVKGIISGERDTLEADIAEIRREAWKKFRDDTEL